VVEIVAVTDSVRNSGDARAAVEVPSCGTGLYSRGVGRFGRVGCVR